MSKKKKSNVKGISLHSSQIHKVYPSSTTTAFWLWFRHESMEGFFFFFKIPKFTHILLLLSQDKYYNLERPYLSFIMTKKCSATQKNPLGTLVTPVLTGMLEVCWYNFAQMFTRIHLHHSFCYCCPCSM